MVKDPLNDMEMLEIYLFQYFEFSFIYYKIFKLKPNNFLNENIILSLSYSLLLEIINNINFKNQNDPLFIFYKPIFSLFINIHEDKLTMSHFLQIKNLINYFLNV